MIYKEDNGVGSFWRVVLGNFTLLQNDSGVGIININIFLRETKERILSMITPQEFRTQWASDNLVQYNPSLVAQLEIAEISKKFLIEAGLPKRTWANLSFDISSNILFPLPEVRLPLRTTDNLQN